jgi:hypothetical protein
VTTVTPDPAQGRSLESTAFAAALDVIGAVEPGIADAIRGELGNQRSQLKLIASENYASPAVLLAMGNWFSDKYAEGTVGHRFYAGCEFVDVVEARAAELARSVFGAPHAYVQPHSGIDANLVAFWAILAKEVEQPELARQGAGHVNDLDGDAWERLRHAYADQRMIGMSLDAGGHLTHGFRPNISGKQFNQRSYGTDPVTGLLDYDEVRRLARDFRPLVIVAGVHPRHGPSRRRRRPGVPDRHQRRAGTADGLGARARHQRSGALRGPAGVGRQVDGPLERRRRPGPHQVRDAADGQCWSADHRRPPSGGSDRGGVLQPGTAPAGQRLRRPRPSSRPHPLRDPVGAVRRARRARRRGGSLGRHRRPAAVPGVLHLADHARRRLLGARDRAPGPPRARPAPALSCTDRSKSAMMFW